MRLWSIQSLVAYQTLLREGTLTANHTHSPCEPDFLAAYHWMSGKMLELEISSKEAPEFPLWAWYQQEGQRKRCDMRQTGYASKGDKIVLLTLEVPEEEVLLSDFALFHYVLNYWYLPNNEEDATEFEKTYQQLGYQFLDLADFTIQNAEINRIRKKIESSWQRIFDLEKEDDGYLYGSNSQKSIQGTFWRLSTSNIIKTEFFTAR